MTKAIYDQAAHRQKACLRLDGPEGEVEVHCLVSASPFEHGGRKLAVLTLEDVTGLL